MQLITHNPSCGYNNGSIIANVSGGSPPYMYSLNGVAQNNGYFPSLNAATGFVYTVAVTDATGQSVSAQATLANVPQPPALSITPTIFSSTCTSADGAISLSASGGTPPYTYSIDGVNYSPGNMFSNLTRGSYFFFVKDASGCVAQSGIGFLPGQFDPVNACGLTSTGEGSRVSCNSDGRFRHHCQRRTSTLSLFY